MPFLSDAVDVKQHDEVNWMLHAPVRYHGRRQDFEVPPDTVTDFASVPRPLVWLLPRYGLYTKAAILHDFLWRTRPEGISLHDADGLFRRAMRELGVPYLSRWVMWSAVRWGALFKRGGFGTEWLKDLPAVLIFTVLMVPVALVPFVVILVELLLFHVLESVAWIVLRVGKPVARVLRVEQPDRPVVAPDYWFRM